MHVGTMGSTPPTPTWIILILKMDAFQVILEYKLDIEKTSLQKHLYMNMEIA